MPSVQQSIWETLGQRDDVNVLCVMNRVDAAGLANYVQRKGLGYPFVHAEDDALFALYQVGYQWAKYPPSWFVIDKNGVIRQRLDNAYDQVESLKTLIETLLTEKEEETA